jgi:hypothetical protein
MMTHTIEGLKARIHSLTEKDAIGNMRIINKLKRQIRKIERKG